MLSSFEKNPPAKAKAMNLSDTVDDLNLARDLNIRGNYESLPQKQEDKHLNLL